MTPPAILTPLARAELRAAIRNLDNTTARRALNDAVEAAARHSRGETVYDPWHYVPVLARKPGALRNGAPFRDWGPARRIGTRATPPCRL